MERKCERCGATLQPDAEFCYKCGKQIDGEITASRDFNLAIEIMDAHEWRFLGIALIILGVLLLVLSIITFILQDNMGFVPVGMGMLIIGILAFLGSRRKARKYRLLYNSNRPKK